MHSNKKFWNIFLFFLVSGELFYAFNFPFYTALRHDSAAFLQIVADPCPCRHNLSQKSAKYLRIPQNRRTFASSIRQKDIN